MAPGSEGLAPRAIPRLPREGTDLHRRLPQVYRPSCISQELGRSPFPSSHISAWWIDSPGSKTSPYLLSLLTMKWPIHMASGSARVGTQRDALAHRRLMSEPLQHDNLDQFPSHLSLPPLARFELVRSPFPIRPHFPFVASGITAQFSAARLPDVVGTHFDSRDSSISIVVIRGRLYGTRGHSNAHVYEDFSRLS